MSCLICYFSFSYCNCCLFGENKDEYIVSALPASLVLFALCLFLIIVYILRKHDDNSDGAVKLLVSEVILCVPRGTLSSSHSLALIARRLDVMRRSKITAFPVLSRASADRQVPGHFVHATPLNVRPLRQYAIVLFPRVPCTGIITLLFELSK